MRQADWARLAAGFPQLAVTLQRDLVTTIPADRLGDWAALAVTVARAGRVSSLVVDDTVTTPGDPDYRALRQLVRHAISPGAATSPAPRGTRPTPHADDVGAVC